MSASDWRPLTEPLSLESDTIHLIRVPLAADDARIDGCRQILSADELARADRYIVPIPRRHFIVCRAALRQLLGTCIGTDPRDIAFDYGPHGKPVLRQVRTSTRLEFSVSHSSDQALIGITQGRQLGVDIEQIDPAVRILKLATRFFSTREATELNGLPSDDQLAGFYRGWTCKESYLKATGQGLSFPLNRFSVSLNPHQPAALLEVVDLPEELSRWRLESIDILPGFAAAVLFEANGGESPTVARWVMKA
jgi:4'-phosphopantetheinyl transferase